jgi:DHHC palmitoyltransferase
MGFCSTSPTSGAIPGVSRWIGPFMTWGLLGLSIYILVVSIYLPYQLHGFFKLSTTIVLSCLHGLLFLMVLWSWLRIKLTNPGNLLRPHDLTAKEVCALEKGSMEIPPSKDQLMANDFYFCEQNGELSKWCTTCHIYCPPRAAHCKQTGRCVAKFDHYCHPLGGPIGIGNYKFYFNFLFYLSLLVIYLLVIVIIAVVNTGFSILLAVSLSLTSVTAPTMILPLFCGHMALILQGSTQRESSKEVGPPMFVSVDVRAKTAVYPDIQLPERVILALHFRNRPWAGPKWENWTAVMGTHFWEWLLPIPTSIQGEQKWWEFELNDSAKSYLRMRAVARIAEIVMENSSPPSEGPSQVSEKESEDSATDSEKDDSEKESEVEVEKASEKELEKKAERPKLAFWNKMFQKLHIVHK